MKADKRAELLSPAGDWSKMRSAVLYGADAVYLAGKQFGMRAASSNFDGDELIAAVKWCHARGVKVYVTVNVMPHTPEYPELKRYLRFLRDVGADAVIVSDIGVVMLIRDEIQGLEIHISTQASAVSAEACRAWHRLGAKRVVLARELTLNEIREIKAHIPEELELECFVHGAMCVAYSGRCLLSNYFTGRDGNHGQCAQSCRWHYRPTDPDGVMRLDLHEELREEITTAVRAEEDPNGETFFMSSKDMCMLEHIPELEEAGISSYKIEGRVKSAYYTAVVTNAYRMALDTYRADPASYRTDPRWMRELVSVSHREYGTGFYFTKPSEDANTVHAHGYLRDKAYLAAAVTDSGEPDADGLYEALFSQRNKMRTGDRAELISPGKTGRAVTAEKIYGRDGSEIDSTPHPGMFFRLKLPFPVKAGDILRAGDDTDGGRE
jgi:putative protease